MPINADNVINFIKALNLPKDEASFETFSEEIKKIDEELNKNST